jgi:transposase InsO family protein
MNLHPNAKTTPSSRALLVHRIRREGWTVVLAAGAVGISTRTAHKWLDRYRREGRRGLMDRRSTPLRRPRATPRRIVQKILSLRKRRWTSWRIAEKLQLAVSTVAAVLSRLGLGRLGPVDPPPPVRRYEKKRAGELLHIDIKKLGRIDGVGHRIHGDRTRRRRGVGWEYAHVCIDDASRVGFVEILPNERSESATSFLDRAVAWYRDQGVKVKRVMTDNGSAYVSKDFGTTCRKLRIRHQRTRPYTPRTNGKAERFIQTLLREWAYAKPYSTSSARSRALHRYLPRYNHHRPHHGLGRTTPMARLEVVR